MTVKQITSAVALLSGSLMAWSQPVTIGGSDLIGEGIQQVLMEALAENGVEGRFQLGGTLEGVRGLSDTSIDAIIVAKAFDDMDTGGRDLFPIAFQVVTLAVVEDNPVEALSASDLTQIFAIDGEARSWAQFTEESDWADRQISIGAVRAEGQMTLEIFNAKVLSGVRLKREIELLETPGDGSSFLLNERSAILVFPGNAEGSGYRFLAFRQEGSTQAFTPSLDSIFFGDYPLRIPFVLTVRENLSPGVVRALARAFLSEEVKEAFINAYFVGLPESERQALLSEFGG
jgi:hypothetical protein